MGTIEVVKEKHRGREGSCSINILQGNEKAACIEVWDSKSPKITVTLPEKQIPSSGQFPLTAQRGAHTLGNVSA